MYIAKSVSFITKSTLQWCYLASESTLPYCYLGRRKVHYCIISCSSEKYISALQITRPSKNYNTLLLLGPVKSTFLYRYLDLWIVRYCITTGFNEKYISVLLPGPAKSRFLFVFHGPAKKNTTALLLGPGKSTLLHCQRPRKKYITVCPQYCTWATTAR